MTRQCLDCGGAFTLPRRGYASMVRCRPCQEKNRRVVTARALRSTIGRYNSGRLSALRRGHGWHLTIEQYETIITMPCHYCGNELNATGAGLDRLRDDELYTYENVVPCCWPCNYLRMRGAFTPEEMKRLGPVLGPIWKVHPPNGTARQTGRI